MIPRELVPMMVAGLMAMDSEESKVQQAGVRTESVTMPLAEPSETERAASKLKVSASNAGTFAAYSISTAALLSDARCRPSQILSLDPVRRCDAAPSIGAQRAKPPQGDVSVTDIVSAMPVEISAPVMQVSTGIEDLRKQILRQYVREKYLRRVSNR